MHTVDDAGLLEWHDETIEGMPDGIPRIFGEFADQFRACLALQGSSLTVTLQPKTDLTYIFREDAHYVATNMVMDIHRHSGLPEDRLYRIIYEAYESFCAEVYAVFERVSRKRGVVEFHIYSSQWIEERTREALQRLPGVAVSMDPLINHNIPVVAVSRGYYLGGRTTFGLTHRPDSKPLDEQLRAAVPKGSEVNLVEDDVFTGGSIRQMAQRYEDHGKIRRVVPGIQVGSPSHLENSGIAVLPVVRYQTVDGTDPVQEGRIELDDPRDFLVGSSGLVVQLPSGKNGRAPYVLPFVSPAERASVDPSMEEEFSQSVLAASRRFFQELEARCGRRIELGDVEPAFVDTMRELLGLDTHMPMVDVIDFCFMHMRELRERMFRMGEAMADRDRLMAELNELAIPKDVVFLDVNGTLFPDESQDGALDQSALAEFVDAARALRERDVRLGLCSDSPLAPLQAIAERLGIDGPIIAENGNVVFDGQREVAVQSLPDIPRLRERIQDVANAGGYLQVPDALSPEFGGGRVNGDGKEWAFGAGRSTSVSVFGDAALVQALHEHFKDEQGLSIDSSPEYGYFALHPGNLRANKGGTLRLLREQGRNVVMVGNSMSDWVPPESGVRCAFVGAARISAAAAQQAHYRAERPDLGGVVDILRYITNDYSKPNGQSHH